MAILHNLCQGISVPPQQKGRPRLPLADVIFAATFKTYCGLSGRRFMGDMEDAHKKGFVSRPVHYNSISKYLEMAGLTPILAALITECAKPLRSVEVDFAVFAGRFFVAPRASTQRVRNLEAACQEIADRWPLI